MFSGLVSGTVTYLAISSMKILCGGDYAFAGSNSIWLRCNMAANYWNRLKSQGGPHDWCSDKEERNTFGGFIQSLDGRVTLLPCHATVLVQEKYAYTRHVNIAILFCCLVNVFKNLRNTFLAKPPSWGREPLALSPSHHTSHRPPQAHPGHPTG